jgi:hypothetical protein
MSKMQVAGGLLSAGALRVLYIVMGAMAAYIAVTQFDRARREHDLDECRALSATASANVVRLRAALVDQSDLIEAQRINYEERIASIRPITRVEVRERLKIVYVDRNISEEECRETASTIDAVRRAGL